NLYYRPIVDKLGAKFNEAQTKLQDIYNSLLQDERIDLRNRITYIEACRGADGLLLRGQLRDKRLDRTLVYMPPINHTVPGGPIGDDYWSGSGTSSYYP